MKDSRLSRVQVVPLTFMDSLDSNPYNPLYNPSFHFIFHFLFI